MRPRSSKPPEQRVDLPPAPQIPPPDPASWPESDFPFSDDDWDFTE